MRVSNPDQIEQFTATIANGATASDPLEIQGNAIFGILPLAGFAGTAITLEMSPDDGATWYPVYEKDGTEFELTVAASQYAAVPLSDLPGLPGLVRLVSGTAASGAETLYVFTRRLA